MARTKIVRLTATRCYLGQALLEIPDYANLDRIRGIICGGGQVSRLLLTRIQFDGIAGTGLANAYLQPATTGTTQEAPLYTIPLTTLAAPLRADGFIF